MPIAFIILGLVLISAGARNRGGQLSQLLTDDFTGSTSFLYWVAGITIVGSIGYYKPAEKVSRLFIGLLLLSMLLSNKGFFSQLQSALSQIKAGDKTTEADVGSATSDPGAQVTGKSDNASASGSSLPATATVGPSQENPSVYEGQSNTSANNKLNNIFGVPPTISIPAWLSGASNSISDTATKIIIEKPFGQ